MRVRAAVMDSTIYGGTYDDNGTMQITFDVKSLLTEYDGCTLTLICQRDANENPYNPAQVEVVENDLVWTLLSHDVEIPGVTECWVRAELGELVEKQGPYYVRFGESKSIIHEQEGENDNA